MSASSAPLLGVVLVVAVVANGLLAGLYLGFSCAIAPAFRRLDDARYVETFRAINSAIVNGPFLLVFFSAPVSAVVAGVLGAGLGAPQRTPLIVAGALCSVAAFAVTVAANVPANRALDRAPTASTAGFARARSDFESRWNRWNLVRCLASLAALALFAVAASRH